MFIHVMRGIFLLCLIGIVLSYIMNSPEEDIRSIGQGNQWLVFHKPSALLAIVAVGVLIIGLDILISRKSLSSISGLFLGLLARGFGIRGMRERVEAVGGVFDMYSKPGKGTRITVTLPIKQER